MRVLTKIIVMSLIILISGCGNDDGKLSGIWEADSASGKWIYRYEFTPKDEGYDVKSQEKLKTAKGDFRTSTEFFLKRDGEYLVMNNDTKFLEVVSDSELKLTSTGMIFKKKNDKK